MESYKKKNEKLKKKEGKSLLLTTCIAEFTLQINESWGSCVHGCEFFSRLGDQVPDQPINTLKNCNYSKLLLNFYLIG